MNKLQQLQTGRPIISNKRITFFVVLVTVSITLVGLLFPIFLKETPKEALTDDWIVSVNDTEVYRGNVSDYMFEDIQAGDKVVLETAEGVDIDQETSLMISEQFSSVRVLVNGEETWHFSEAANGAISTNGTNSDHVHGGMETLALLEAPFLHSEKDATVRIEITPSVDGAFTNIENYSVIGHGTLMEHLVDSAPHTLVIACFLILLGLFMVVIGLCSGWKGIRMLTLLGIGSSLSGMWCLGSSNLIELFSHNNMFNTHVDHYSLYLFMAVFSLLQCIFVKECRHRRIVWAAAGIQWIYTLSAIVLTILEIIPLGRTLNGEQIMETVNNVIFVAVFLYDRGLASRSHSGSTTDMTAAVPGSKAKPVSRSEWIIFTAFVVHFVYGIFDSIRYQVLTNVIAEGANVGYTYAEYGLLITILLLFFAYILDAAEAVRASAQNAAWQKLALTDSMTGLNNRAYMRLQIREAANASVGEDAIP